MQRVLFPVRLSAGEKAAIQLAARTRRMSANSFIVDAAMRACGQCKPAPTAVGRSPEAEDALAALVALGLKPREAEAKVVAALEENPTARVETIIARAFGSKP